MNETLVARAKEIIKTIKYITIATVTPDCKPWNSPVFSAYDDNYNFYWNSWKENQHSINIESLSEVFIVIYDSTAAEGTGEGVYIQATVEVLSKKDDIEAAVELLQKRKDKPSSKLRSPDEFLEEYPRRVYKATPLKFWVNGEGDVHGNYVDVKTELDIAQFVGT